MAYREFSYIGVGEVHLALRPNGALLSLGNVAELGFSFDEEKNSLRDYTQQGGGNANVISRINNFTGSLKMHDYTADNLAKALRGLVTQEGVDTVSGEAQPSTGTDNELIPFDFAYDATVAPVVTLTNATACVADTDYELTPNGIKTLPGSNIDANGVLVSYTKAAAEVMNALVASGQEFRLYFDAVNEAQSGKSFMIDCHRVKFSPASGLQFLGGDFGEIPLDFEVLSDSSVTGTGISKYLKTRQIV